MGGNVKLLFLAALLAVWFGRAPVSAQTGQLAAGHVWGNTALTQAPGRDSSFSGLLGRYGQFYADEYGATHNGTDDTAAIQAALNAADAVHDKGAAVVWLGPYSYTINTANLTIPLNVTLSCSGWRVTDQPTSGYLNRPCAIYVNPAYTIINKGSINSVYVFNKNIVNPVTMRDALTMVNSFSGTGITMAWTDALVRNVTIGGFATCISSTGVGRVNLKDIMGDCTNGVVTDNSHDLSKFYNVEFFPFMTTNAPNPHVVTYAVSGAADNGAGLYRLTIDTNTFLVTGDTVWIAGVGGAVGANGKWAATVVDSTHIDLQGSAVSPTTTGATTIGETYIAVTSVANLAVGQTVTGTGVPGGATITAVWSTSSAISISAPATATGAAVALTFANGVFTTAGALNVHTGQRSGTAFTLTNSEGLWCKGCFAFGYNVGVHVGVLGGWFMGSDYIFDSYQPLQDPTSIALLIDGSAYGNQWIGGMASSVGRIAVIDTTSSVPNTISLSSLSHPANPRGIFIEHKHGYLVLDSNYTNSAGAPVLAFGPTANGATISGNILPSNTAFYGSDAARQRILFAPSNISTNVAMGTFPASMGSLTLGANGSSLGIPLTISGASSVDANQGAQIRITNPTSATPSKTIRVNSTGGLDILNNAYSSALVNIADGGIATFASSIHAPTTVVPTMIGGTAANSTLTLESTSVAGTSDSVVIATGPQVTAMRCDTTQHCRPGNGNLPTIASGACGALTNGAVLTGSNDQGIQVTIGAAATTSCVVAFSAAWVNPPRSCELSAQNAAAANQAVTGAYITWTAAAVTITGAALAGANYSISCH
jgi:hypothetical protein